MELTAGVVVIAVVLGVVGLVIFLVKARREDFPPTPPFVAPSAIDPPPSPEDPMTLALTHWLLSRASEQTQVNLAHDPLARQRIVDAAAKALTELQGHSSTTINLPFLTADASGPKHFEVRVTRDIVDGLR